MQVRGHFRWLRGWLFCCPEFVKFGLSRLYRACALRCLEGIGALGSLGSVLDGRELDDVPPF